MIPVAKPILGKEEQEAVQEVLCSGMIAQGDKVTEFEKAFAEFTGVKHAIATSNGTTALHVALLAHGIKAGDEVITTSFSFIATGSAIKMVGATPVFIDISKDGFMIDVEKIEAAITPRTKAILPVHLFGEICEMQKIMEIAQKHNLIVIEDACQAHGAELSEKKAGSFGTGCFSFYPTKNMTTGEGGMVTANDDVIAAKVRKKINHGSVQRYYHDEVGYNFRMTNIAAAIGLAQLQKIEGFTAQRRENAAKLQNMLFAKQGIVLPKGVEDKKHVFHQYTIRVTKEYEKSREEVMKYLQEQGVGCAVYYPVPIHKQEAFAKQNNLSLPNTERVAKEVLSLPVHPGLREEDFKRMQEVFKAL